MNSPRRLCMGAIDEVTEIRYDGKVIWSRPRDQQGRTPRRVPRWLLRLICVVGLHDWVEYPLQDTLDGLVPFGRICVQCGKEQCFHKLSHPYYSFWG